MVHYKTNVDKITFNKTTTTSTVYDILNSILKLFYISIFQIIK